jgi:hypothetical protein
MLIINIEQHIRLAGHNDGASIWEFILYHNNTTTFDVPRAHML